MKARRRYLMMFTGSLLPVFALAADPPPKADDPAKPMAEQPRPMDQHKPMAPGELTGKPAVPGPLNAEAGMTRLTQWEEDKKQLETALPPGQDRSFYRQELARLGYMLTSVNKDKADYVEYEIVKNGSSYEVQLNVDKDSGKAKKVSIGPNMWKARGTKQAMQASQGGR
jgi:hypothetical protein